MLGEYRAFWTTGMSCLAKKVWISCKEWAGALSWCSSTFPLGQIIGQSGMHRTSAYPHLLRKFSDSDMTVLHDQSPHLVNDLIISGCWGPTGTSVTLHWRAAIFDSIVPLLNLCFAHSIVDKNPTDLPNGFHLAITKLLAKFDEVPLLELFCHFCGK
jgi:hypothetical protein